MKRVWLKRILWTTTLTLLLVILLGLILLNSRGGAQWAVDWLVGLSETDITYPAIEGSLLRGISMQELHYRDADRQVTVEGLNVNVNWSSLALGRLVLDGVTAQRISHLENESAAPGEPLMLELPQWPFIFCIGRLGVDEVVSGSGESAVSLEAVSISDACIDGDDHNLVIATAGLATLGVQVELNEISLDASGSVPVTAQLSWDYPEQGWRGAGPVSGTLVLLELEQKVNGPYPFATSGTLAPLEDPGPLLDFSVAWQDWQAGDLSLHSGNAQIEGLLESYALEYTFTADIPDIPQLKVTGTGQGNLDGLAVVDAVAHSSIGGARYQGSLDWQEEIRSSGALSISGFDPSFLHQSLSGSINGTAEFSLQDVEHFGFGEVLLAGIMNGKDFSLNGAVQAEQGGFRCLSCRLLADNNELKFDGSIKGESIEAELEIRAPSLTMILPGLEGRLNAQGQLSGSLAAPIFTGRAGGTDLAYAGWTLDRLNINSGSASADEIQFSLLAQNLGYGDLPPAQVSASGAGALDSIDVNFDWDSPWLAAGARLVASVAPDGLSARVHSASISEEFAGKWSLNEPFEFATGPEGASVTKHRWTRESSSLEVASFSVVNDVARLKATLNHWPLQSFNGLLPENQRLQGRADAQLDVSYQDESWLGQLDWRQTETVLVVAVPGNPNTTIKIPQAHLSAQFVDGGINATAQLDIEPDVSARAQLFADRVSTAANVKGNIMLTGKDWSWVSAVVPELDRLDGDVSADLALSGPLLAPEIKGSLDWKNGRLLIPALNVTLDEVDLSLRGEPNGAATASGSARAGEGRLELDGRFESIMTPERNARISIKGDTAELLNWPEYHVWVSPELEISSGEEGWELRGKLALPRAEVHLRELPEDAVTISEDVRVLGAQEPATRPTRYFGEAQLTLGEQVHVRLFGLDTKLAGDLLIRVPRGRQPTATGQVSLVGGTFSAYGQELKIEQGTLLFTGPFDNPVVDVKAVRVIETFDGPVSAGIHLQGRALSLTSKVYSTPSMAEADALSYLVIGRPLSQVSEAEGSDVSNAAIALGLGQASRITQQIGDRLGLDQLSLVGDGGDSTALVAGKQINKRLYARYAYGVFSRLGTVLLRYKLSRRVAIEAASGEQQSLDILYTVEKQ